MLKGVDVSSHQPDWQPTPDLSFCFLKATEGHTYISPTLPDQLAAARSAGLVVGFYHFLWPGDPQLQAQWFEQAIRPSAVPRDLLVCDWEATKGGTASEADKDAFLAEVRRLLPGYKVGLYVNRSMWNASGKRAGDFLWLAEYASQATVTGWKFWQYSDHSPVANIDQNYAGFSTVTELRDWINPLEVPVAERIPFRGLGLTCSCVVESLPYVELDMLIRGVVKESIDIFQLGYRDDVAGSQGTHSRGGVVDVGQRSAKAIDIWRRWGWTEQDRSPWFPDAPHAHGWPYGCPHLSDAAKKQNTAWNNRRNGLINAQLVIGRWPVLPWKQALAKEKPRMLADVADAVLSRDGQIENLWKARDPGAGDFVTLKTAIKHLAEDSAAINKQLEVILAKLGELEATPPGT